MERAVPALADRGGRRAAARRLDGRGAHERAASSSRELRRDDGRLLRSWQDGRANLLAYAEDYARAARGAAHAGRARRRRLAGRGARRRRRARRAVRRRRARRVLHDRHRRRSADRPAQGLPGQRHPVGELPRRRRAAAAGRAHRRRRRGRTRRALGRDAGAGARASTRPRSRTCSKRSSGSSARRSRWRSSASPTIPRVGHWSTCSAGGCCRLRYGSPPHRVRAPSSRRSSLSGPSATVGPPRTCASSSRVSCRSPTPTRCAPSSTTSPRPGADVQARDARTRQDCPAGAPVGRSTVTYRHRGAPMATTSIAHRPLGAAGASVSPVGLGCMGMSGTYGAADERREPRHHLKHGRRRRLAPHR